jgi:hypothetical protein
MVERCVQTLDVERVLPAGEVIVDYPDDRPCPSHLILRYTGTPPPLALARWTVWPSVLRHRGGGAPRDGQRVMEFRLTGSAT